MRHASLAVLIKPNAWYVAVLSYVHVSTQSVNLFCVSLCRWVSLLVIIESLLPLCSMIDSISSASPHDRLDSEAET